MPSSLQFLPRNRGQLRLVASLLLATCLCVVLLALRFARAQGAVHSGLIWNLFLAWLPIVSALVAYNLPWRRSFWSWASVGGCTLVWLAFFPNAPYLVTDLMHLPQPQSAVPFWYDLLLVVTFAWTGCFLGLASLILMQAVVRRAAGKVASWMFAGGVLSLGGFGVYLGRFLRWNSWDVFVNPTPLLLDVAARLRHPLANLQTYAFSALFSLFLICAYLMLVSVSELRADASGGSSLPEK